MLSCVPAIGAEAAASALEITAQSDGIQISGGLRYKTNAVYENADRQSGLVLRAYKESKGAKGETVKVPDQTNSYIAVDVTDNAYTGDMLNKYIDVTYDDSLHDSQAWICIEYVNTKGKTSYTEKAGVKNTGNGEAVYTFCLDDALFNNSLDGYDFKIINYLGSGSFAYATDPYYIKQISVRTDGTVSPIDIEVASENKGNIFYTDDPAAFDVIFRNVAGESIDFSAEYTVENISSGKTVVVSEHAMSYTANAGEIVTEKIELDAEMYGVYNLTVTLSGNCSLGEIKTTLKTDFSRCVLNDTPNVHFGTLSRESLGDLMLNAGIGTTRGGYLLPYQQGSSYQMGKGWLPYLKNCELYGMERIGSIMYSDGYSLPGPDDYENMKATAIQFINSTWTYLDKLSIGNEPELMNWVGAEKVLNADGSKGVEAYRKLGERYGYMASAIAEAVKERRDNAGLNKKLGAFETHLSHSGDDANINWSRNCMEAFYTAALDVMKEKNVLDVFDAFVFHGYLGRYDAEVYYDEELEFAKSLLDKYGYGGGSYEIWSTEGGFSTSDTKWYSNIIYGDEHEKANRIVKTYTAMMGNNSDGIYAFYDFINDGDVNSVPEANFGMINASSRTKGTPYSAKETYLAVSAVNKLTGNMTKTEKLTVDGENCYGYKFTNGTNYVCAYWWDNLPINGSELNNGITAEDNEQHALTSAIDLDNAHIYDLYGNLLEKAEHITADGKLIVTNDVIYVSDGNEPEHSTKVVKPDMINVSGTVMTGNPDVNVSLIVVDEGTDLESLPNGIKYVDQTVTNSAGAYSFIAYMGDNTNNIEAYIYTSETDEMKKFEFKSDGEDYSVVLKDGIFRVDEMSLDMLDMSELRLRVRFSDTAQNVDNFKAYAVFYKGGELTDVLQGEGNYEVGGSKLWNFGPSDGSSFVYDTVKIMLWNGEMVPLVVANVLEKTTLPLE